MTLTDPWRERGLQPDPAWEDLSQRALARALPRQREDGLFPYRLNDECADTIHYHREAQRGLTERPSGATLHLCHEERESA